MLLANSLKASPTPDYGAHVCFPGGETRVAAARATGPILADAPRVAGGGFRFPLTMVVWAGRLHSVAS